MIKKEFYATREDGVNLFRTFSTAGKLIMQVETGIIYAEAIDIEGKGFTYEETDTDIDVYADEDSEMTDQTEDIHEKDSNAQ